MSNLSRSTETLPCVVESRRQSSAPRARQIEDMMNDRLDAAIGIKNGLIYGSALWVLGYILFSLIGYIA